MRFAWLAACSMLAACPGGSPTKPELAASGPKLPPPRAIDPSVRGAAYLTAVGERLQPQWAQFLEDCRLRLPGSHPLNRSSLVAIADLAIARDGRVFVRITTSSGNGDFDTAVFDVASDAGPLPVPPPELISDDDQAHLAWTFARDARQAGAATAAVVDVELPLVKVIEQLIANTALERAITRVASSERDPAFGAATELVMTAVIREGLYSGNGAARRAAVEAVARANLTSLVADVHAMAGPIPDLDLRLAAIAASAQLRDPAVAATLATDLRDDLANRPRLALAKVDALVALHRGALAAPAIRAELPSETALLALGRVPDPELAPKLTGWLASTDSRLRGAVCEALPNAAPALATTLILKGLRDADAGVRARCADASVRDKRDTAITARLRELAKDRDVIVRARAIAALGVIDPANKLRSIGDRSPAIRLASVAGARDTELRWLAKDLDPDVRAAALTALGERAPELMFFGIHDLAANVRRAALATIDDDGMLEELATDPAPEVATAALIRLAGRRGRAAISRSFLASLAATPSGAPTRVRIALAWLLARP